MRPPVSPPLRLEQGLSVAVMGEAMGFAVDPGAPDHATRRVPQ